MRAMAADPGPRGAEGLLREVSTYLNDVGLLLISIFLIPVAILVLGLPVALIIRLSVAAAHWR